MKYGLCEHCGAPLEVAEDGSHMVPNCCPRGKLAFVRLFLRMIHPYIRHPQDTNRSDWFAAGFDNVDNLLEEVTEPGHMPGDRL